MSAPLVEIENLRTYFRGRRQLFGERRPDVRAVDGVSFSIASGESYALVGESGCGKSTTGRSILRLVEPTGGTIRFGGRDVMATSRAEMRKKRRTSMQMIFQDPYTSINPRHTVATIIGEPLKIHGKVKGASEYEDRVRGLMATVGLADRLYDAYPHELDGGRRQRIGIARALALDPEFIVCDEPVSALDVSIQAQILNLLMDLQDKLGLTYLFITHDLSVVKHISDDIVIMYMGQIVERGPTEELFARPIHPYGQALLSAIPVPKLNARKERIILKSEVSSPIDPKPGCRFAPRCAYASPECTAADPALREVSPGRYVACRLAEQFV